MPTFKPKNTKKVKIDKKNLTTLDSKHKEFLTEFHKNDRDKIPKLKKEKKRITKILEEGGNKLTIDVILDYKDKLKELKQQIKEYTDKKMDYLLDNSKFIFDYFENKKNISNVTNLIENDKSTTTKTKLVNSFFKINSENDNQLYSSLNINNEKNNTILQKYLINIDETFLDINSFVYSSDVCRFCFKGELIPIYDEGVLICNFCSRNVKYLIENEKPSYKEPPKEVCFYAYKKINHFKEVLSQFQGKETTQIPHEVINSLKNQIKKERINYKNLTYYETKTLLKKIGYSKYYEHINFIKHKLGIPPPIISQELEEILCNFFIEIQYPYAKYCPDYRINFLHYYYVLYKFFELLGQNHYLIEIPMLKDRIKLIEQDSIWKKICDELDWEYIPTI
jgi:hypothetical protein